MKITALGTGGAFSTKYGNSQIYLDTGDPETSLLFDCGRTTFENLARLGMPLDQIRNIYISHTHSDHIGGLPDLALACYFYPQLKKPNLFARRNITKILWNNYLAIMLATLAHGQLPEGKAEATFHDYFNVNSIASNSTFKIGDITYKPVQTVHVVNGAEFMDSYGLFFEAKGRKILITGDTQFAPNQLMYLLKEADLIIHDCETSPFKSGVHAHVEELATLPDEIKSKICLIHYGDDALDRLDEIKNYGFAGVLEPGETIELL